MSLWVRSRVDYGNPLPANGSSPGGRIIAWNEDACPNDDYDAGCVAVDGTIGTPCCSDVDGDGGGR